jgi:hypothetical protein
VLSQRQLNLLSFAHDQLRTAGLAEAPSPEELTAAMQVSAAASLVVIAEQLAKLVEILGSR